MIDRLRDADERALREILPRLIGDPAPAAGDLRQLARLRFSALPLPGVRRRLDDLSAASRRREARRGPGGTAGWPDSLLPALWLCWLPLARRLVGRRARTSRVVVQGIVGPPGAGKTTLVGLLAALVESLGGTALALSLDDFYLPSAERAGSGAAARRGPPGTHDVALCREVLAHLKAGEGPVSIPRFDKSARRGRGDRVGWRLVPPTGIVFFEGWFVGLARRSAQELERRLRGRPRPEIERALAANERLAEYAGLWRHLDGLWLLHCRDERWIRDWRLGAERESARAGAGAMTAAAAGRFVEHLLTSLPPAAHYASLLAGGGPRLELAVELDALRRPVVVRRPRPGGRC
jgi:D-glycerate 3-kinase